jgi:hypothetical protein
MVEAKQVDELANAFIALDKLRNRLSNELIKAANQALGADLFKYVGFRRLSQGIHIDLSAVIPCENPSAFFDGIA